MEAQTSFFGEITVVRLMGWVDVESAIPFRKVCSGQLKKRKIVFNFSNLSFVGSCGILPFLQAIQEFYQRHPEQIRFCGVNAEFAKIFASCGLQLVPTFDSESKAIQSFETFESNDSGGPMVSVI
jgi:anti-anti-sigma factor